MTGIFLVDSLVVPLLLGAFCIAVLRCLWTLPSALDRWAKTLGRTKVVETTQEGMSHGTFTTTRTFFEYPAGPTHIEIQGFKFPLVG